MASTRAFVAMTVAVWLLLREDNLLFHCLAMPGDILDAAQVLRCMSWSFRADPQLSDVICLAILAMGGLFTCFYAAVALFQFIAKALYALRAILLFLFHAAVALFHFMAKALYALRAASLFLICYSLPLMFLYSLWLSVAVEAHATKVAECIQTHVAGMDKDQVEGAMSDLLSHITSCAYMDADSLNMLIDVYSPYIYGLVFTFICIVLGLALNIVCSVGIFAIYHVRMFIALVRFAARTVSAIAPRIIRCVVPNRKAERAALAKLD